MKKTNEQRFHERVEKESGHDPCWIWTGVRDGRGYAWMWDSETHEMVPAQIWIWIHVVGVAPRSGVPMQTCRNNSCVRPAHLEPRASMAFANVFNRGRPRKQNDSAKSFNGAKTECAWGHEYNEENTRTTIGKDGKVRRNCRICDRERPTRQRYGAHAG